MKRVLATSAFSLVELVVLIAIVAVLAGLLLPILAAEHEKARRTSCMSNFNEIGKALLSYSGDHNGYFPSSPVQGLPGEPKNGGWTMGDYHAAGYFTTDSWCEDAEGEPTLDGDECIYTSGHPFNFSGGSWAKRWWWKSNDHHKARLDDDNAQTMWNLLGYAKDSCRYERRDGQTYTVTMPVGLGILMIADYIPDARSFYCPSAGDMPGADCYWRRSEGFYYGCDQADEWEEADRGMLGYGNIYGNVKIGPSGWGWTKNNLIYGRWDKGYDNAYVWGGYRMKVEGQYEYRNVVYAFNHPDMYHKSDVDDPQQFGITGTTPLVCVKPFMAMFPTEKELAGRAIVTDRWTKGRVSDALQKGWGNAGTWAHPWYESYLYAGAGIKGHRRTYNVLYGDGHCEPYDDPSEDLVWRVNSFTNFSNRFQQMACDAALRETYGPADCLNGRWIRNIPTPFTKDTRDANPKYDGVNNFRFKGSALEVWHNFDVNAGIDTR